MEGLIRIGKTVKTHGINGEVLIKFEAGKLPANESEPVFLDFEGIQVPFFIESVRSPIESEWFVVFEEYDDKTKAEKLLGRGFYVHENNIAEKEKEFTLDDLIGFEVIDEKHGLVGVLTHIQKGAQDLMIIEKDQEEIFIPFVEDFLVEIDEEQKRIMVATPDGLLDLNK
ncbi:MAG: 16S rRNA processing protein RimM [Bacteroidetes bacterium GWF2_43_63]|nr:MAG: 16S rRNA processing protein RimM [Bacteroidetes bacterium GWE2_42_42]OFY53595.1 MAG: 16S rRNA processing protein RimM [Bacteroidetes bacterium GWF2_43_63]HBG71071.1 16S rRNA processing protein RimM [Bacteroidales bacterium]HCB63649.1 16S rRNA processing protein RimM [Bacteroidales bacterium]HCY24398.1 16S rRNA processing protein RimM [Bacteroidales bacterium]